MSNKRGVNAVIATLFLVVIVIIAIIILWSFLRPSVKESGEQAASAAECIKADVYPTECSRPAIGEDTLGALDHCPDLTAVAGSGGKVDGSDLAILLGDSGPCPTSGACPSDLNGDGTVNYIDIGYLFCVWGASCSSLSFPLESCISDPDKDQVSDVQDRWNNDKFKCSTLNPSDPETPSSALSPSDGDTCDDCASGVYNPLADGCDAGIITKRGAGAADVTGLSFGFVLEDDTQKFINTNFTIDETQTELFTFNIQNQLDNKKPKSVLIYPLIGKEKKVCSPKSAPLNCVL